MATTGINPTPNSVPDGVTLGASVPQGVTLGTPTSNQPPPDVTLGDAVQTHHWYDEAASQLKELNTGFTTALSQTGQTAERALAMIPGVKPLIAGSMAQDAARAAIPMNTPGRMAGNAIENIIEFAAGDEALKGASFVTKMDALQPLRQALQKSPAAAKIVGNMVLGATRQAALAGGQAAVHGQTPEQIRTAALIGGGVGAIAEPVTQGVQAVVNRIKPIATNVLGEPVTALASQQPGASSLAENVASIRSEPATAGAQQQASQRALVTRAQQITKRELDNLNAARQARWQAGSADMNLAPEAQPITAPPERQLGTGQPQLPSATAGNAPQIEAGQPPSGLARTDEMGQYEGDFQPQQPAQPTTAQPTAGGAPAPQPTSQRVQYIEERPPNFQPIDSHGEAQTVGSFGQAADKIREHAGPVFQAFDDASGGEYTRLRGLRDQAYESDDYKGVRDAEKGIDALFDQPQVKGTLDRLDYKTVKSAWRTSKVLDAVDNVMRRAINIPDPSIAEDAGVWRGISGGMLMNGMKRLDSAYGRTALEQVLGNDGVTGLTRMASLLQSPQYAAQYGHVINNAADDILAKSTSKIPQTLNWARSLLLNRVATDPKFSKLVEYVAKNRIPQTVANSAISAMLNQQDRPTIQNKEIVPENAQRGIQSVTLPAILGGK
jgi:hypothetical protein